MKGSAIAASLACVLSAAPVFAQTPAQQPKPAQPPATAQPKPAQPPATPAPAQPTAPAPTMPAPQPPAPFPAGAKIAFFQPEIAFQNSSEGKAALTRVQALVQKKQTENADKAKQLQTNQQKLQTSGSVMNEAARSQLEKEIERQQKEAERFQQDAQAEINELQQEVQSEFVKKVTPVIEQVAKEKGLHLVFDVANAGLAWGDPGLDLTNDVIKRMDAGKATGAAK
jgi:outer membrane protein